MSFGSRIWQALLDLTTRRTKTSTATGPDEIGTPRQAYWASLDAHHDHPSCAHQDQTDLDFGSGKRGSRFASFHCRLHPMTWRAGMGGFWTTFFNRKGQYSILQGTYLRTV